MTIIDAINSIDSLKPNGYTQSEKIKWLSKLDGMVKRMIIDTHEDGEDIEFHGYTDDTPITTELLVKAPYDDVYLFWMESWIDYYNGEYARYNNSVMKFNETYSIFSDDYNRAHMPLGEVHTYF